MAALLCLVQSSQAVPSLAISPVQNDGLAVATTTEVNAREAEASIEKVQADSSRTKYLSADDALAYGIVDRVLRSEDDLPAKPSFLNAL